MEIYEGKEPYLFISYAHKNSKEVAPIIELLVERGFRVWYDSGLEVGTEWPALISSHLKECSVMLAFISDEYVLSKNCRNEVNLAMNKNKTVLAVYLKENVELTGGMDLQLASVHCVFRSRHSSDDALVNELVKSKMLAVCKDKKVVEKKVEKKKVIEEVIDKKPIADLNKNQEEKKVIVQEKINFSDANFEYFTDDDGKVCIKLKTDVKGNGVTLIPSTTIDGISVTKIANEGFKNSKIKSIIIGEGITEIGDNAFEGCSKLTNVSFSNTIEDIGEKAFDGCKLIKNLEFPKSVKTIGSFAFRDNVSLRGVKFLGQIDSVGYNAFCSCKSLNKIDWRYGLKNYSSSVFYDCPSVTEISSPYYNCYDIAGVSKKLKKVVLTYKNGTEAYTYDNLNSYKPITITGKVKNGGCGFAIPLTDTLIFEEGVESIQECELKVKNVVLPKSFNSSKNFYILSKAQKVYTLDTREEWLKKFGAELPTKKDVFNKPILDKYFYYRNEWTFIDGMPVAREDIIEYTEKSVENKVKKLPTDVETTEFCPNLYPYLTYEYDEFANAVYVSANGNLPKNLVIPPYTLNGCENIIISREAFLNNENVESVYVSGAVSSIEEFAFSGCKNLKSVEIGEGVQYIEGNAFNNCNMLTELTLPHSLIALLSSVSNLEKLNVLTVKGGTHFPNYIASNCNSLITINAPYSVNIEWNNRSHLSTASSYLTLNSKLVFKCDNVISVAFDNNGDFNNPKTEYKYNVKTQTLLVKGELKNLYTACNAFSGKITNVIFDKDVTIVKSVNKYHERISGVENVTASYSVALEAIGYLSSKAKTLKCYNERKTVNADEYKRLKINYEDISFVDDF